jgi:hypothetical protein
MSNTKELFDTLLDLVNLHCSNNDVSFAEGLGIVRIVQGQVTQNIVFYTEEDLQASFTREARDLYFVLMSSVETENVPQAVGVLDLLADYLTEEYHKELNLQYPYEEYEEYDDEEYDDEEYDDDFEDILDDIEDDE